MNKYLSTSFVAAAAVLVAACQQTTPKHADAQVVGLANPASVYCADQGGTSETVNTASGAVSICHLPDGRKVEEWELYRSSEKAAVYQAKTVDNAQVNVAHFVCDNGLKMKGTFFINEARAVLELPTETIHLPEQVSGSGVIYSNGIVTFRGKGNEMTLERPGLPALNCQGVRK